EVALNVRRVGVAGTPFYAWVDPGDLALTWVYHAVLLSCLLVASGTALSFGLVPRGLLRFGIVVGILGGTLAPWPWPVPALRGFTPGGPAVPRSGDDAMAGAIGLQPRPVARTALPGLAPGAPALGLLTALAGSLAGWALGRGAGFLASVASGRQVLTGGEAG